MCSILRFVFSVGRQTTQTDKQRDRVTTQSFYSRTALWDMHKSQ
jgi:hypothetical protein